MKWGAILGILAIEAVIALYEWPKMNGKHDKVAFVTLSVLGGLVAVLLVLFPGLPGPTEIVETLFHPVGKLLENK